MADDVITRDRPVAKYLWLIYVRERTKWTSCKVRDVDGSSVPLIIALKSSNSSRMNSNFSFCKNPIQLQLLSTVLSAIYWIKFYSFYRKSENGALSLSILQHLLNYMFLSHYLRLLYPFCHYGMFCSFTFVLSVIWVSSHQYKLANFLH